VTLAERLLALHRALSRRRIPHAFGGAIALAYWTLDPRGTSDIDLNVFVPAAQARRVLEALPDGVGHSDQAAGTLERDGQVRLWWDDTPIDLFLDYAPIHAEAARNRRSVPFEGTKIPVLGPNELAIFKAMFDRTRDWADIEALVANQAVDLDAVTGRLGTMLSADDVRFARWDEAVRRGQGQAAAARDQRD
jgi:hypothetical protein